MAQVRQIRTSRLATARDHMAGSTLPFGEEKLFAGLRVAGDVACSSLAVQGVHEIGKGIQLPGRQGESRHARPRNPVVNQIAQLPNGLATQPAVPGEPWRLICAPGVGAMATDTPLRIYFPAFLETRRGGGRILRRQQRGTR